MENQCDTDAPISGLLSGLMMSAMILVLAGTEPAYSRPPGDKPEIRAVRTTESITIDGRLDEESWRNAPAIRNFIQIEPDEYAPASFDTEVRMLYDDDYLYIGAVCYDGKTQTDLRAPELRRDFDYWQNDLFGIVLDPFGDERNAVVLQTNPYGAQRDLLSFDAMSFDRDWIGRWIVRTEIRDSSWTVEMAIPWSTIRYDDADAVWGVNFTRNIRRNREVNAWVPFPRGEVPYRMTYAGIIRDLEPPPPSSDLQIDPYVITTAERVLNDNSDITVSPQIGGDVIWAMNPNTVLDLTINTDFAQTEVDQQVINLERFSILFPEKRRFFLENASLYSLGREWLEPFFSRRIGLDEDGTPIPIDAGARFTSRSARYNSGAMVIRQQSGEEVGPSTFAIGRYSRNIGRENRMGMMLVSRFDETGGTETGDQEGGASGTTYNHVAVADAVFRPVSSLLINPVASVSLTSGIDDPGFGGLFYAENRALWGRLEYVQAINTSKYRANAGYVRRPDLLVSSPAVYMDLRGDWLPDYMLAFDPSAKLEVYHRSSDRRLEDVVFDVRPFSVTLRSGAKAQLFTEWYVNDLEFSFSPLPDLEINPGRYNYYQYGISFEPDASGRYWVNARFSTGGYFDGTLHQLEYGVRPVSGPFGSLTIDYGLNRFESVGVDETDLTTHLVGVQGRASLNPRVHLTGYYQYNSSVDLAAWNLRFSWEFRPLSFIYLVFNDTRTLETPSAQSPVVVPPDRQELSFKVTYRHQF